MSYSKAFAITPHDANAVTTIPSAIYVGTGGNITMQGYKDTANVLFANVASGTILPFRPKYVRATGTTANNIVGLT